MAGIVSSVFLQKFISIRSIGIRVTRCCAASKKHRCGAAAAGHDAPAPPRNLRALPDSPLDSATALGPLAGEDNVVTANAASFENGVPNVGRGAKGSGKALTCAAALGRFVFGAAAPDSGSSMRAASRDGDAEVLMIGK